MHSVVGGVLWWSSLTVVVLLSIQAPIQRIADRIAGYFVPLILVLAFVAWLSWLIVYLSRELTGQQASHMM